MLLEFWHNTCDVGCYVKTRMYKLDWKTRFTKRWKKSYDEIYLYQEFLFLFLEHNLSRSYFSNKVAGLQADTLLKTKSTSDFVWYLLFHMTIVSLITCNRMEEGLEGFRTKSLLIRTEGRRGNCIFNDFKRNISNWKQCSKVLLFEYCLKTTITILPRNISILQKIYKKKKKKEPHQNVQMSTRKEGFYFSHIKMSTLWLVPDFESAVYDTIVLT